MEESKEEANLFVILKIKSNVFETMLPFLTSQVESTRKEEGNLRLDCYRDSKQTDDLVVFQRYSNMNSFNEHFNSQYSQFFLNKYQQEWGQGEPNITFLKPEIVTHTYKQWQPKEGQKRFDVIGIVKIKPECLEQARKHTAQMVQTVTKEEGVLKYDWFVDAKDPLTLHMHQSYAGMEAFMAHVNSECAKTTMEKLKEWCSEPATVRMLEPINVVK